MTHSPPYFLTGKSDYLRVASKSGGKRVSTIDVMKCFEDSCYPNDPPLHGV